MSGSTLALPRRDGDPLVLLHAIFQSRHSWSPLLDQLTAERDSPPTHVGHAGSPPFKAGQPPRIEGWTDAVESELDAAGFGRPDIVGHSLGGWVSMELAKRGRVRARIAEVAAGSRGGAGPGDVGRGSDFFGPHAHLSTVGDRIFARAIAGKPALVLGYPDVLTP